MKNNVDIKRALTECADAVEIALSEYSPNQDADLKTIFDAQRYSLLGGGKRIRPFLVASFCRALGGSEEKALPLACAIEMIHTYSLIHDDLPCMDNDDYRRGKLTNHKVFGEATAVLAGDALLTKAFSVISSATELSAEERIAAVAVLSESAGECGMIGGQMMDMAAQDLNGVDQQYLEKMHGLKTGALIRAAAKLGCIAAGKANDAALMKDVEQYASKIGLAFQIVDDVLDVIGDKEVLGKNVGVDHAANKLTFMRFYSVDAAMKCAEKLTEDAIAAVSKYDQFGELSALAEYLLRRIQ